MSILHPQCAPLTNWFTHTFSARYALAFWLATMLALFLCFVLQLEPAQWAGLTVLIIFVQTPRMNLSKVIWWSFGTIVGTAAAVSIITLFSQAGELCLLSLALWMSCCAAASTLFAGYRVYGAILSGYTCAIVSMSAVEHPDLIFNIAAARVSCIFAGMAASVLVMGILLPKHRQWRHTREHLEEHLRETLRQCAAALVPAPVAPGHFTWRHTVDRLAGLQHALDVTTADSADSRARVPQARALVASLFELQAQAQAIAVHLSRAQAGSPSLPLKMLLTRTSDLLAASANNIGLCTNDDTLASVKELQSEVIAERASDAMDGVTDRFILDRLDDILGQFSCAVQDWAGLFGTWTTRRDVKLSVHRDYSMAFVYGLRMFVALTAASAIWFLTEWPTGSFFILNTGVACAVLSLANPAPAPSSALIKSALFCAVMAFIETFWLMQRGEGFGFLALVLGVFLLPAAYVYRHPGLVGSAIISMLVYYGMALPQNNMNYDIITLLNNGLAGLGAVVCGFFAFRVVPTLSPEQRKAGLLRAVRRELADGTSSEESWVARLFDRLRLLHRAASAAKDKEEFANAEKQMLLGLQLGLRQRRLRAHFRAGSLSAAEAGVVAGVLGEFHEVARHPAVVALFLRSTCAAIQDGRERISHAMSGALAEMWEMTLLMETSPRDFMLTEKKETHVQGS